MLRGKRWLMWIVAAIGLCADEPVRNASDYPAQTPLGKFILAAENLGPSVPGPYGGLYLDGYITIEVAVFPATAEKRLSLSQSTFALRINGAKGLLRPESPGAVAAAIKYPDWENQRVIVGTASSGGAGIILGRPDVVERFPGDRRPLEQRRPPVNPVPRIESPVDRKRDELSPEEYVQKAALTEGDVVAPASGCLFFRFTGKRKRIKNLELVYEGPLGETSLRIP